MSIEDPEAFEARPLYRRVGLYLVGIFIIGLTASVLVFTMSMQGMGWPGIILGAPSSTAVSLDRNAISLYVSPPTRLFFNANGGNYDTLLAPWRKYFNDRKLSVKEFASPADIAKLKPSTLVLPSAVALSDEERREILAFRDRGGSVLLTWATGTRSGTGEWVGGDFITKLAGAVFTGEIAREAEIGHLVLRGESPASLREGAGKRIWLGYNAEKPLRLKSPYIAARFLNWSRSPSADRTDEGAITYWESTPGAGRVMAFGFAETSWEQQPADIHAVVDDALAWLRRQPTLLKAAWPQGRQSAQLIEMDTEEGFPNALRMAALMKSIGYRGAFYMLGTSAAAFPQVAQTIHAQHEVGFHGDVHVGFKDQSTEVQSLRLTAMQAQLKSALGDTSALTGFRAPTEGYDKTTEILLQQSGVRHHLSGPQEADLCLPSFAPIANTDISTGLLRLPRTQRDDLNLLKDAADSAALAQGLTLDFDLMRSTGCLGVLSVHSQNLAEGSLLHTALPAYLAHVKQHTDTVWLASPQQVDRWWRDRERLRVAIRASGARFEFDVSVGGKGPVTGGSFLIVLPQKGSLPQITGVKPGMPQPRVTLVDDYRASIVFDNLEPGNYFYQANF